MRWGIDIRKMACGSVSFWLAAAPFAAAQAQAEVKPSVNAYRAEYFSGSHPSSAYEMVGLSALQREAQHLRRAANRSLGLDQDDPAGVGVPILRHDVTPSVREANLMTVRQNAAARARRPVHKTLSRQYAEGERPRLVIFTGPTRSGKSRAAVAEFPFAWRWALGAGGVSNWFDGYQGQEEIIVEEAYDTMAGVAKVPFDDMKRLIDWYPMTYQTKKEPNVVEVYAKTFIFTSCVPPERWYVTENGDPQPEWLGRLRDFGDIRVLHYSDAAVI